MIETVLDPVQDALDARVARERDAHTDCEVPAERYRLRERFAHILAYPSRRRLFGRLGRAAAEVDGLAVLDYGCGRALLRRPDNALLRLTGRAERWAHRHGPLPDGNQYVLFDMRQRPARAATTN